MSDILKVTVLGTGVLGSQIAFQAAYTRFADLADPSFSTFDE